MSFENNNNNDKKKEKRSLYSFLDKEGFYIILFLCVCIVAVTAVWVSNRNPEYFIGQGPENSLEERYQPEVTLVEETGDNAAKEEKTQEAATTPIENKPPMKEESLVKEEKVETPQSQVDNEEQDEEETVAAQGAYTMMLPVVGKLGTPFADDRLVFQKTLGHWSTHKGIDLHAIEGSPVRAVLDGEVIEVVNDTIMGITISLAHEGGLITRYSNLSTDAMVKLGDQVSKGQTISGVGRTAAIKSEEGPLLHFQVLQDGKHINPEGYLPKLTKASE